MFYLKDFPQKLIDLENYQQELHPTTRVASNKNQAIFLPQFLYGE